MSRQVVSEPKMLTTVEEYLRLEEASPVRHEYIAGMLYEMPGTTKQHNRLIRNLVHLLDDEAEAQRCQIYFEAVKVQPFPELFYYPDFVVVCDDGNNNYVIENPCVTVEILPDSSEDIDRREKWAAYRQFSSLEAYLLVHQTKQCVEGFFKQANGTWLAREFQSEARLKLPHPEMQLELALLYKGVL
jgi:Uma2 family endonuclease